MQNIGASNAGDVFYRYKMPRLATKIEGRGNGIKTNVMNNVDVAKALERPPTYLLKYFGCELGAQTNFDEKTGTSIVNGAHQTATIAELVETFIKKYVQCYSCGNPETMVKIDKRENITLKCKACGAVSDVDPRYKLNTFIVKNPPEPKLSKAEKKIRRKMAEAVGEEYQEDDGQEGSRKKDKKSKKEKKEKKDKKEKKEKKKKGSDEEGNGSEGKASADEDSPDNEEEEEDEGVEEGDGETEWMTDLSAEAVAARAKEQLSDVTANMVTIGNLEEEEEQRKREEKEKRRAAKAAKKAEKEARKKLADASIDDDDDEEDEDEDDIDIPAFRKYCLGRSPEDAAKALSKMEVPGGPLGTMRLLWDVVFGGDASPLDEQIPERKDYLKACLSDATSQLALLAGMEHFVTVAYPDRVVEVPKALKALYDEDICEEEVILAWNKRTVIGEALGVTAEGAAACRKVATPVINWLEEADEESD